jgi:hypothetical protein
MILSHCHERRRGLANTHPAGSEDRSGKAPGIDAIGSPGPSSARGSQAISARV